MSHNCCFAEAAPFCQEHNSGQNTEYFFSMKMVKCTKDEYWHSKWAIGRFSSQKLEKLLSAHVNWMLATGLLAGRYSELSGLSTHRFLFKGPGVFNRHRYGRKSLLSDKRKIKTRCCSKTVGSVKRLQLHRLWLAVTLISDLEQVLPSLFFLILSWVYGCLPVHVNVWLCIWQHARTFTFVDRVCAFHVACRFLCVFSPPVQH